MIAIAYGLAASFFFAFTFILNRAMDMAGGSWLWSAALRFILMTPMLLLLVLLSGRLMPALRHLRRHVRAYLLWSTVGFGLFYAPLTLAAAYGPGWLVAGTWQITILAGSLLVPWLTPRQRDVRAAIPWRDLRWSLLILCGIALLLWQQATHISPWQALSCLLPVLLAAFMYPLGNRKMMQLCHQEVDTLQRVLNMTLASLPFWLLLAAVAWWRDGPPAAEQLEYSFLVALFSGVIATLLFFAATNRVRHDPARLAAVEATQSGEVLFSVLGERLWLHAPLPSPLSLAGIALIIFGMIAHSLTPWLRYRASRSGRSHNAAQ